MGSAYISILAKQVSPTWLLISAAVLFEVAVFLRLAALAALSPAPHRLPAEQVAKTEERPVGGNTLAGIYHAIRSPYLLGVSAFLLLYSVTSTFVYSQQAAIVAHDLGDRAAQTVFFSNINFGVNTVALVLQLFFTGRIVLDPGRGARRSPSCRWSRWVASRRWRMTADVDGDRGLPGASGAASNTRSRGRRAR